MKDTIIKWLGGYTEEELDISTEYYSKELNKIHIKHFPHNNITEFFVFGANIEKKRKYWKAEFEGVQKFRQLHTYLKRTDEETEEFVDIAMDMLEHKTTTAQDDVERILRRFEELYRINYKRDISEEFLTPREVLGFLNMGEVKEDCELHLHSIISLIRSLKIIIPEMCGDFV